MLFYVGEDGLTVPENVEDAWPFEAVAMKRLSRSTAGDGHQFKLARPRLVDECTPAFLPYVFRLLIDIFNDIRRLSDPDAPPWSTLPPDKN